MDRYVAFLRSINLGRRRVKGPELEEVFTTAGFKDPHSFLASGNIVFDSTGRTGIAERIEKALQESLGYDVPTMIRTADEVLAISTYQPFTPDELDASTGKPQVSVLQTMPTPDQIQQVRTMATADDRLAFYGQELYWLPVAGMSDAELDTDLIERTLGMQTRRTQNTMQRLSKKFLSE